MLAVFGKKYCVWLFLFSCFSTSLLAEETKGFVVYDDELKNAWVNWSWADVVLSAPAGNAKPIKVQGEPWSALALHHDAFAIDGFSKLSFFINGGADGGQTLAVKLIADGKAFESNYLIQPKQKTWSLVEIPLSELGVSSGKIDGLWLQTQAQASKPYYVTRIMFE